MVRFLASGCYSGYIPKAPGTFGTLAAIPFYLLVRIAWEERGYVIFMAIFSIAACVIASAAEREWGKKDCPRIVIDEWAGFLVTMIHVPPSFTTVFLGFAFFRCMDIFKPPPIRKLEKLVPGGAGVVADDLLAGVYAGVILNGLVYFFRDGF